MGGWIRRDWVLAFLGRPDFQSRGPKMLILEAFGTSGRKIGVPQKCQIQPRRIQHDPHEQLPKVFSQTLLLVWVFFGLVFLPLNQTGDTY